MIPEIVFRRSVRRRRGKDAVTKRTVFKRRNDTAVLGAMGI
jgi:hypothetical protein